MNNLRQVLTEIMQLTNTIETNYPERYQFLDENPMIIPKENHPDMDAEVMQEFLENLKQLLKHHLETHKK
ncbi:MAG: hypothetical protein KAJ23_07910 [Maribacter sp.]|nr:hypothetical protein [Maribacter sp.]